MTPDQAARYLAMLGLARRPPSTAALGEILTAQLARVPFENLSKLQRAHRGLPPSLPSFDEFLGAVERDRMGGTCYLVNSLLGDLLAALGYRRELRGADMDQPDVHIVNVVDVAGRPWLVDAGYAAPFCAPLPLDAPRDVRLVHGADTYVLRPRDAAGRSRLDHYRGGEIVHGYTVQPPPRRIEEFMPIVVDSYRSDSPFLSRLRIVQHQPGRTVALRDFNVTCLADGRWRERVLPDRDSVQAFVAEEFGIPPAVTAEAFAELAARAEAWRI